MMKVSSHTDRFAELFIRSDGEVGSCGRTNRQPPSASERQQRACGSGGATSGAGSLGHNVTSCHAGPTYHSRDPSTTRSKRTMRTPLMMCCLERGFMDDTLCQPRYLRTCHYGWVEIQRHRDRRSSRHIRGRRGSRHETA
ncbi:hypothetical protein CP881_01695 [Cutibacterium acnes]|nr:hypothetical protein CP881_01695 [Cutibacterium acnes]TMT68067.1 hypothetical protein DMX88_01700 [Cutibacterium acnes]